MKRIVIVLAVAVVVAWYAWFRSTGVDYEESEGATVVAVQVGKITHATLRGYVTAYGVVEPEPAGNGPAASSGVAPSVAGVVVAVDCAEGKRVAKGDLLFQIESRVADVAVDFAEKVVDRQKQLYAIEGTSERVLQEAQQQLDAARVQQALLAVRSPLAGTVTRVNVNAGEAVDLSTVMAEVVDLERLIVTASVPGAELVMLKVGQAVEVFLDRANATLPGEVYFISPQLDPRVGTGLVRVTLAGGPDVRPGLAATIRVITTEHVDRLAVPVESVVKNDAGEDVIAIVEGDDAKQIAVTTGLRDAGLVEIEADGLQAGMTVVTQGAYGLPQETRIRLLVD